MKILHDVPLNKWTSFATGGLAERMLVIEDTREVLDALFHADKPLWFLGSGANVLISDHGLDGTVVHLDTHEIVVEEDLLIADAGVDWDTLVQKSITLKKWGLERMSGIPGDVGAAVVGNIAAYGQAVSDTLQWVEVVDTSSSKPTIEKLEAKKLGLKYRFSDFQTRKLRSMLIVRAAFKLEDEPRELTYASATKVADELKLNPDDLIQRRKIILEARRRIGSLQIGKDAKTKTAGSFFRNPEINPKQAEKIMAYEERGINYEAIKKQNQVHGGSVTRVSAAHVLLAAGFKRGQSWGDVRLHPDHILKIENTGHATSQDIYDVAQEIIQTVKEDLGIKLEPEVRFLGKF